MSRLAISAICSSSGSIWVETRRDAAFVEYIGRRTALGSARPGASSLRHRMDKVALPAKAPRNAAERCGDAPGSTGTQRLDLCSSRLSCRLCLRLGCECGLNTRVEVELGHPCNAVDNRVSGRAKRRDPGSATGLYSSPDRCLLRLGGRRVAQNSRPPGALGNVPQSPLQRTVALLPDGAEVESSRHPAIAHGAAYARQYHPLPATPVRNQRHILRPQADPLKGARVGAAAMASAFGMNSAVWENSTGAASFGAMITRIPIRVLSNSFSAKP